MNTILVEKSLELFEFFEKLRAASGAIIKELNSIFSDDLLQGNPYFHRWSNLLNLYRENVKTKTVALVENDVLSFSYKYEVYDFYLKNTENINKEIMTNFRNECQDFIDNLPETILNKYFGLLAVKKADNFFEFDPVKKDKRVFRIYKNYSKLPIELQNYTNLVVSSHSNVISAMKFMKTIPTRMEFWKDEIKTIINSIKIFFDLEMGMKKDNIEFLFIRRLLEEYLSSFIIAKHNLIHPITKIYSYLKFKGIKINNMDFFKYKHVQKDEGLRYVSFDGKVIGSEEINMEEIIKVIECAYNYLTGQ